MINYGTTHVREGILVQLDAGNVKSYSGSGTVWTDLSGNGNNATLNSYTYSNDGYFSGAGHASVPSLTLPRTTTFEVVYNSASTDTFSTYGRIMDWNDSTISLGTTSNYQLRMWYNVDGTRTDESPKNGIGTDGLWHHVIYTYNGQKTEFYLDGEFQNGANLAGNLEAQASLTIGDGDGHSFGGKIALVKVYNKTLTSGEVKQNFNAIRGRFGI